MIQNLKADYPIEHGESIAKSMAKYNAKFAYFADFNYLQMKYKLKQGELSTLDVNFHISTLKDLRTYQNNVLKMLEEGLKNNPNLKVVKDEAINYFNEYKKTIVKDIPKLLEKEKVDIEKLTIKFNDKNRQIDNKLNSYLYKPTEAKREELLKAKKILEDNYNTMLTKIKDRTLNQKLVNYHNLDVSVNTLIANNLPFNPFNINQYSELNLITNNIPKAEISKTYKSLLLTKNYDSTQIGNLIDEGLKNDIFQKRHNNMCFSLMEQASRMNINVPLDDFREKVKESMINVFARMKKGRSKEALDYNEDLRNQFMQNPKFVEVLDSIVTSSRAKTDKYVKEAFKKAFAKEKDKVVKDITTESKTLVKKFSKYLEYRADVVGEDNKLIDDENIKKFLEEIEKNNNRITETISKKEEVLKELESKESKLSIVDNAINNAKNAKLMRDINKFMGRCGNPDLEAKFEILQETKTIEDVIKSIKYEYSKDDKNKIEKAYIKQDVEAQIMNSKEYKEYVNSNIDDSDVRSLDTKTKKNKK